MDKIDIYDKFIECKAKFLIEFLDKYSIYSSIKYYGRFDVIDNFTRSDHKALRTYLNLNSGDYVTYLAKHFYSVVDEGIWLDVNSIVNSAIL